MQTLLLDATAWDLVLDVDGNIAVADDPYAMQQDVSSAIRLKFGELYFDTTQGVPYNRIIGKAPNIALIKAYIVAAAKTVPGVVSAVCFISSIVNRTVSGQVQATNSSGQTVAAGF